MEQRPIDGLLLWSEIKRLEELARDRYLDTSSSSPAHARYRAQMQERTNLKEIISAMPTIDLVYAAGACYCDECVHHNTYDCPAYDFQLGITSSKIKYCSYGQKENAE